MKYRIKYLIDVHTNVSSVSELAQYLTLYSTIFFSKTGETVVFKDKKTNKKFELNSCIKKIVLNSHEKKNYYTVTIYQENNVDKLELFNRLILQIINTQRDISDDKFVVLQDDISKYYATKAYSKLFDTENLLRTFITELMSFFAPMSDWGNQMGRQILNIDKDKDKKSVNNKFLYDRDLNQLTKFLTKLYYRKEDEKIVEEVRKKVQGISSDSSLINNEIKDLKQFIDDTTPKTIFNTFVQPYTKTSWQESSFKKDMEALYNLRCKIAHSNSFDKKNYEDFNNLSDKLIKEINNWINTIEEIKEVEPKVEALLNEAGDDIDVTNIQKDTLIVPARKDGFEEVFLNENQWYYVRISNEKINQIKYIAAYQAQDEKCIQYYAEVDTIKEAEDRPGYKIISFKNKATPLENNRKIELGKNQYYAPQSARYVASQKLFDLNVKTLEELFS